jgi:hypothetical protein
VQAEGGATVYLTRIASLVVLPEGEPLYSERATTISLDDEAAGEFVVVKQEGRADNSIAICDDEWPAIREAIDRLIADYKKVCDDPE